MILAKWHYLVNIYMQPELSTVQPEQEYTEVVVMLAWAIVCKETYNNYFQLYMLL